MTPRALHESARSLTGQPKPPKLVDNLTVMRFIAPVCASVCCVAVAVGTPMAQGVTSPQVELVSIRPSGATQVRDDAPARDRFDWPEVTLAMLVSDAYDLFEFQVVGGPDWVRTRRWDVSAKAAALSPAEARELVRRLIEDRFALRVHTEKRELPIYNLVLARTDRTLGPKIKRATVDCTPFLTGARPMQESPPDPNNRFGLCSVGGAFTPAGLLTPRLNGQPLAGLVHHLEDALEQRVIDRTGLTGNFDIELSYFDEKLADKSAAPTTASSERPSLFTALREQLGMKLEAARGPVDVVVIDSVSEPKH